MVSTISAFNLALVLASYVPEPNGVEAVFDPKPPPPNVFPPPKVELLLLFPKELLPPPNVLLPPPKVLLLLLLFPNPPPVEPKAGAGGLPNAGAGAPNGLAPLAPKPPGAGADPNPPPPNPLLAGGCPNGELFDPNILNDQSLASE